MTTETTLPDTEHAAPSDAPPPRVSPVPILHERDVAVAFRFAFGQEPRQVDLDWHRRHWSFEALRADFLAAPQFRSRNRGRLGLPRDIAIRLGDTGLDAWIDMDDLYVGPGMMEGDWEPAETSFMRATLRPGDVMVDIGAMMGWFALSAAACVGPSGAVVAFEPQPRMHGLLRRSILANRLESVVSTHEVALWDAAGDIALVGEGVDVEGAANKGHTWLEPVVEGQPHATLCRSARLDDLAPNRKVDFVKIDVEGAEYRVLRGGERLFRSSHPRVMCELFPDQLRTVSGIEPEDLLALMRDWGFAANALTADGKLRPWMPEDIPVGPGAYTSVVFI